MTYIKNHHAEAMRYVYKYVIFGLVNCNLIVIGLLEVKLQKILLIFIIWLLLLLLLLMIKISETMHRGDSAHKRESYTETLSHVNLIEMKIVRPFED